MPVPKTELRIKLSNVDHFVLRVPKWDGSALPHPGIFQKVRKLLEMTRFCLVASGVHPGSFGIVVSRKGLHKKRFVVCENKGAIFAL